MTATSGTPEMTERPAEKPAWPKTEAELVAYIREMLAWPETARDTGEGYGRCVYAMSYAAVATFNYVGSTLGVTGFQASCADLDFLRHTRRMQHGFLILNADDLLYPQYDLLEKAREWITETRPQLADEARRLLVESPYAHPDVLAQWEGIAALAGRAS